MAGLTAKIRGNRILAIQAVSNTRLHINLFIIVEARAVILLTLLTIIEASGFAKRAATRTDLTESSCRVCVVSCRAGSEATVGDTVEVVSDSTEIANAAISRRNSAANTLNCARLACVWIACSDKLSNRAIKRANGVSNVEVV